MRSSLLIPSLAALVLALPSAGAAGEAMPPTTPTGEEQLTISIDATERPLETVLGAISRRAGVNVVCNEPNQPAVTMRLTNVTWQEAVQLIADRYQLVVEKKSDRLWQLTRPPMVRMQFQDAPLTVVLDTLARQASVNIVISDEVDRNKRLTMTLEGVPWRHALDVIVKAMGYAWVEQEYKIIRVVTPDKLTKDLDTRIYRLNYVNAVNPAKGSGGAGGGQVKEFSDILLGITGVTKVVADQRTNIAVVTATPVGHDQVGLLLRALDVRTRQVQIEMKFVDFSVEDVRRIGFDPLTLGFDVANIGTIATSFRPFNATPTSSAVFGRGVLSPVPQTSGNLTAAMAFEAISTLSSTEIIQAPQVLTLDNLPASILIGREQSYAEEEITPATNGGQPLKGLKEAQASPVKSGIEILVTPRITGDGYVAITLEATNTDAVLRTFSNKDDPEDAEATLIQLPDKSITEIKTSIMVGDGKTAMIGGLLRNRTIEDERKVPGLGSVPVLGWLFKKREDRVEQRNLTIFITPRVVQMAEKDPYQIQRQMLQQRLSGQAPIVAPVESATAPKADPAKP